MYRKESSNPGVLVQHIPAARTLEDEQPVHVNIAESELRERELQDAEARRRFVALKKAHRSYADPIWEKMREEYAELRKGGAPLDSPEMRAFDTLDFLIESELLRYGRRAMLLERAIHLLPDIHERGAGQDKISRTLESGHLHSALHNVEITTEQILSWYEREKMRPGLSEARLEELRIHAHQLDVGINAAAHHINSPADPEHERVQVVNKSFVDRVHDALKYAENNVAKNFDGTREGCLTLLSDLREFEAATVSDIFSVIDPSFDPEKKNPSLEKIQSSLIREKEGESLAPGVVERMEKILASDSQVSGYIHDLIIVKARIVMLKKWLDEHPRETQGVKIRKNPTGKQDRYLRKMEEIVVPPKQRTPDEILGLASRENLTEAEIEKSFLQGMHGLDITNDYDLPKVIELQGARQALLSRIERKRMEEERVHQVRADLVKDFSKPDEAQSRPFVVDASREIAQAEKKMNRKKKILAASLAEKAFDSVAGLSRKALMTLGLAGAATVPFHDSHSSEPIHAAEGVDVDQDNDTEGPASMALETVGPKAEHTESLTDDYVVKPGDEVRKIVMSLIKEEGLRPTHEKVNMLSHIAMEENGISGDGSTLAIGTVLDLHDVHELLDEMAGKPKVAEKVASIEASSIPVSPDYAWTAQGSSMSSAMEKGSDTSAYGQYAGKLYTPYAPDAVSSSSKIEKTYGAVPTLEHPEHALKVGEYPMKIIHRMLLESGGNWSSKLMGDLVAETLEENGITEAEARKLPVGRVLTFKRAAWYLAERSKDRAAGKKMRTISVLKEQMREAGEM